MTIRLALVLTLGTLLGGCAANVGTGCQDCDYELEPLVAQPVVVASCQVDEAAMKLSCTWAQEESLIADPIKQMQANMSVWALSTERIPASSNGGGVIEYDLSQSSWEPGKRLLFRTSLEAAWDGDMQLVDEREVVASAEELQAGVEISAALEVWDVGLLTGGSNVVTDLELHGAISFESPGMRLGERATVLRVLVDPNVGIDLYSTGHMVSHIDRPGYYRFDDPLTVTFDDERN